MNIKVCGMRSLEQLQQLEKMKADFAGFIFYEKSARYVGDQLVQDLQEIRTLRLKRVGVFVNESVERIKNKIREYGLSYVQLHGDESPDMCKELQSFVSVIKAIRVSDLRSLEEQLKRYDEVCDYFLFDTDSKQYGGTGKQFNWELLKQVKINKPFFLSGGIGAEDTNSIKSFEHPMLYALDVNSRFEIEPGLKDMNKLELFLNELRAIKTDDKF